MAKLWDSRDMCEHPTVVCCTFPSCTEYRFYVTGQAPMVTLRCIRCSVERAWDCVKKAWT